MRRGHPNPHKGEKRPPEVVAKMVAARVAKIPPMDVRFWQKVDKSGPGGCWLWTGALRSGYGVMWQDGTTINAHRYSLILAGRPPPENVEDGVVDHMCRVTRCVNPAHLRIVSLRVNALENNDSAVARCANRLTCINGHPRTPENTGSFVVKAPVNRHGNRGKPRTTRYCRICRKALNAKYNPLRKARS